MKLPTATVGTALNAAGRVARATTVAERATMVEPAAAPRSRFSADQLAYLRAKGCDDDGNHPKYGYAFKNRVLGYGSGPITPAEVAVDNTNRAVASTTAAVTGYLTDPVGTTLRTAANLTAATGWYTSLFTGYAPPFGRPARFF